MKGRGKMKRFCCSLFCFLLILSGCSNGSQSTDDKVKSESKQLQIITTFYPMYYFAKQVAGESANIDILVPNGVEPHDWDPTAKDLMRIQKADVFIYNSRYFETWTEKVFNSIDKSKLKVLEASKNIDLMTVNKQNTNDFTKDPHVWLSPVLAQQEVDNIAAILEKADPKNKGMYKENANAFKTKLKDLDLLYKETIDKAPKKDFVTQHAAFGYLAKQYGLNQIPIAGLSPDVEPTLNKMEELTKMTKKKGISVIYFEGLTSPKVAKTLAKEIGAETEVLNPLEGLTKEELKQGLDYLGVMEKNLTALKKSIY